MSILKKRNILKLAAIFMLVAMMAGTFAMHGSTAFAARAVACGSDLGVGDCIMAASNTTSISGLSFISDATFALSSTSVVGTNHFTFHTTVTDVRNTTAGWKLKATSAGITNGTTIILLNIDSVNTTDSCTPVSQAPATTDCPTPTITATALDPTTPATFATETAATNGISGVVAIAVTGSYSIPAVTPAGNYSGQITLSLLGTSA